MGTEMKHWLTLRELENIHGGHHREISKSGKSHAGGDRCCVNDYDKIYDRYLPEKPKVVVEVGVFTGTGLRVFSDYYPDARIIGLDISPETVKDPGRAEVHYFDQTDPKGLDKILNGNKIDVVIDDGLHRAFSMVNTYNYFREYLNNDAVYFIEDIAAQTKINDYIHDCEQFQPNSRHGRIAVVTKHDKGITEAGVDLIKKYKDSGDLK